MAFKAIPVTVGTTATPLYAFGNDISSAQIQTPAAAATVFIGGPEVVATVAGGFALPASSTILIPRAKAGEIVYGIVAAATQAVVVLANGV